METAKERALVWAREDNERRSRAQSELERDEQELAESTGQSSTSRLLPDPPLTLKDPLQGGLGPPVQVCSRQILGTV